MFNLIIYRPDGSVYWREYFNDLSSAQKWLATEQTRSYWKSEYTFELIDNTPAPIVLTYSQLREKEYPPISEYLDGIVNGDPKQIQKYIDDCRAVKAKYPKPVSQ